ncbi:NB-ARC domain-containing protein [Streptomyces sp. NPDC059564]|uniref:NB-ARC domain-containing protein n=1 Tax=Streptomyces sp. NPDC059564 TaxID=3346865 RepID=UPI0036926CE9
MHAAQGSVAVYRADHVTYQAAVRSAVSLPHQVGVIPRRASAFQDRAEAQRLRAEGEGGGIAAVCQVLLGMGGVGKTQLAADYARRVWENGEVDLLLWVTAASRQTVIDAYAHAAVDVLAADPADPERASKAFLAWLEPKPEPQTMRWLIVLDDVADPGDLTGLWPPTPAHGRILLTTRRRDAALTGRGRVVPVGLFTPVEATSYLHHALAAHGCHEPATDLTALADDLGHLPLALSQAAAYLIDTHLDASTYRARLADRARQLPELLPEPGTLPDDQPDTVAAAWSLSLERADQLRPVGLARPMIQLAAMLDPNGIPAKVLTCEPALTHLAAHRTSPSGDSPAGAPSAVTAEEAIGTLRALHRLSLVDHTPDTPHQAVHVHQLTQRAIRDPLTSEQRDRLTRTAADALIAVWPETERNTDLVQALRANATTLTTHAEDALHQPYAHAVLYQNGRSLGKSGQVGAAIAHFHHLFETTARHSGPDQLSTLTARSDLYYWHGMAGDAAGAAEAFTVLLEDYLRVLGPDHPNTLTARSNLAHWRGTAGDAVGAAEAFTVLLEDQLRVLGPDHPRILTRRTNLAHWRRKAGYADGK